MGLIIHFNDCYIDFTLLNINDTGLSGTFYDCARNFYDPEAFHGPLG